MNTLTSWLATVLAVAALSMPTTVRAQSCLGDCDGGNSVTVDEIITGVNIGLGTAAIDGCLAFDSNADGLVTVDEIVTAVNNALSGCPAVPTETPTPTDTPRPAPTSTPTPEPVVTNTPPPVAARIDLTDAAGSAGSTVTIGASLAASEGRLFAASVDVVYDTARVAVARNGADPDCTIDPSLAGPPSNKMLLLSTIDQGDGIELLRVGVISFTTVQVLPDGPLFTCNFTIDRQAPTGVVTLAVTGDGSDQLGGSLPVVTGNVTIDVGPVTGPTLTPTPPPAASTPTPGETPGGPVLRVGDASGLAGEVVSVAVTLEGGGGVVAATSHDIVFDPQVISPELDEQSMPVCTIAPAVGPGGAGKMLLLSVLPVAEGTQTLRVGVLSFTSFLSIPDGELFRCDFRIAQDASGAPVDLGHLGGAANADGDDLAVTSIDGTVTVVLIPDGQS